jgi:hypothetical protein
MLIIVALIQLLTFWTYIILFLFKNNVLDTELRLRVPDNVRRWVLALSIGPNLAGFYLRTEAESSLRNTVLV